MKPNPVFCSIACSVSVVIISEADCMTAEMNHTQLNEHNHFNAVVWRKVSGVDSIHFIFVTLLNNV